MLFTETYVKTAYELTISTLCFIILKAIKIAFYYIKPQRT